MARTGMWTPRLLLVGALVGSAGSWCAGAGAGELSTEALWGGARTGGGEACLRAGGRIVEMPVAHVNPFGNKAGGEDAGLVDTTHDERSALCVFGAMGPGASGAAPAPTWTVASSAADEMATGSIAQAPVAQAPFAQAPFGGRCAEECDASLTLLTERDREALIALPERLRRTLLALPNDPNGDGGTRVAREAAATLAGENAEPEQMSAPLDLSPGDMDCTWRRFEGGRALVQPTGRCRIGRDAAGAPTLEEVTGEGLALRLEPLTDHYSVYLGRAADAGAPAGPYDPDGDDGANRAGLAARVGNQVHLLAASGASGFAVLTLSGN